MIHEDAHWIYHVDSIIFQLSTQTTRQSWIQQLYLGRLQVLKLQSSLIAVHIGVSSKYEYGMKCFLWFQDMKHCLSSLTQSRLATASLSIRASKSSSLSSMASCINYPAACASCKIIVVTRRLVFSSLSSSDLSLAVMLITEACQYKSTGIIIMGCMMC